MKICLKKFIFIIFIYALLLCFGTSLHATQNKQDGYKNKYWEKYQNHNGFVKSGWGHNNGNGYGHWFDKWKEPGNGFGHWFDKWKGSGNGFGHRNRDRRGCKPPPGCNAPEPISSALFVLGGAGLGLYRKFKNKD